MQLKINLYFFNLNFSSKKRITVNFLTFKGFINFIYKYTKQLQNTKNKIPNENEDLIKN